VDATVAAGSPPSARSRDEGDVDAIIDRPRLTGLQIRICIACALVLFCDGYDLQALALAVPGIAAELDIAPSAFSTALSASLFGMAIGGALFAPLGDRLGRKPMLLLAMGLVGGSTLGALLHPSAGWIAFCRLVTGIGLAIAGVNAATLSGEYVPARWRFLIMTILTCFVPLGAFSAAFMAPVVIEALGWRGIFLIGGIAPLVVAGVLAVLAAESLKWLLLKRRGDARIARIARHLAPDLDPSRLTLAQTAAAVRGSVFGLLSRAHRIRTLVVWLSAASGAFSLYLMVSWLPTVLREAAWTTEQALRATAAVQFGGIVGSLLMAWAIDRRRLLPGILCGYGGALLALLAIGLLPGNVTTWQLLLLLVGAGTSGMQALWMAIAVVLYPLDLRATSAGWLSSVSRIGAVAAPLAGGAALAAGIAARPMLLSMTIPIGLSTLAIVLARRHFVPPRSAAEEGDAQ
jgi:AAHS family 4-hydroxybenzoate transporter-like MFS transporter